MTLPSICSTSTGSILSKTNNVFALDLTMRPPTQMVYYNIARTLLTWYLIPYRPCEYPLPYIRWKHSWYSHSFYYDRLKMYNNQSVGNVFDELFTINNRGKWQDDIIGIVNHRINVGILDDWDVTSEMCILLQKIDEFSAWFDDRNLICFGSRAS